MWNYVRSILLFVAAALMFFAAFTTTTVTVPHLREDLLEISVRPTLLSAVMLGLYFACIALFGFAVLVLAMAIRALRVTAVDRVLIAIIAAVYVIFGISGFIGTGSHHMLGYLLIGLLLSGVVALRK